jgi:hypothetical protein
MFAKRKPPPRPTHIARTNRGEELVRTHGREPGRGESKRGYRSARDSTGLNADNRAPIDPRMPEMPPP